MPFGSTLKFKRGGKLPIILQDEMAECGHACIAMISHYHGQMLGLAALRKQHPPSPQGVTLKHIHDVFLQLGFTTRALRLSLTDLKYLKTPALLHWNMNHFVVLKKIQKNKAIIHDPAIGIQHCDLATLNQSFTGIALEIQPTTTLINQTASSTLRLSDLAVLIPDRYRHLILLLLLSCLIESLALLNPFFIQYATDQAINTRTLSNVYVVACGFVLLMILHALTEYIRSQLILYITTHFKVNLSASVFKHILSLPTSFFETRQLGDIQAKFQSIEQIQTKISTDFVNTILDGLLLSITFGVMFFYSKALTLIVLSILSIILLGRYVSYQALKNHTSTSIYLHAKIASFFLETLRVIIPLKLFLKENARFETWYNRYIDALNADILITKQNILYRTINQLLLQIEQIIIVCLGIHMVINNQLTLGMLIAFLAFRNQFVNKASSFVQQLFDYRLLSIQLSRLSDIVLHDAEKSYHQQHLLPQQISGQLTVEKVAFQYHPHAKATLKAVSFEVAAGERVAIIGPSGCGKTTLLKIIMGLLQPTEGQILIDNMPLTSLNTQYYRTLIAAVMQDDHLLNGSILENITFFSDQIDMQSVYDVAKIAHIHETIIRLPMGYETLLGEMGSTLSGGQKQRLLLARALYKKPKILLMDEATNHLDTTHEHLINQALASLNITQILVAHRPETIRMANRSITLEAPLAKSQD